MTSKRAAVVHKAAISDGEPAAAASWLTVAEVADYLRLRPRTVYDMVAREKIPFSRAGGRLVFARDQIDQWLSHQHRGHVDAQVQRDLPAIIAGSHDPLLEWAMRHSDSPMALMTRGSRDGLRSMVEGRASAALIHLPASDLQSFNLHAVAEAVRGQPWVLIHWARRTQGLICAPGNPLAIEGLASLRRKRLRIGRRQPGAGSRELFELLCRQAGLPAQPRNLHWQDGYSSEDDLGAAVLAGEIDCGLGVLGSAQRLNLHFIPLLLESADLLIDRRAYFEPGIQSLLALARHKAFAAQAQRLGGYDLSDFGRVRWNAR